MDDPEVLDTLFREAVAAIDDGDVSTLETLLPANPRLARERLDFPGSWLRDQVGGALDGFFNRPYLLWFVAEDPVRNGKFPRSVAQVAQAIIRAAERECADSLQEQLRTTLHLACCSPVGRDDGLQIELIDALIDGGASPDATLDCLICCNLAAAEHLLKRGARLTLATALCLGRWDDVTGLGRTTSAEDRQVALAASALNGKAQALARLVELGIDLDAFSTGFYTHATPLHHAVWSGSLEAVQVLVEAGAELGTKDRAEHATPLGWAEYALGQHNGQESDKRFAEIAAYLRDMGGRR